jgi:hypothetical protein
VKRVRVVSGEVIAEYDRTGTWTQKYQAKSRAPVVQSALVSAVDTPNVRDRILSAKASEFPDFLPIGSLYSNLKSLVGSTLPNIGHGQERNRGGKLHEAVSKCIGLRHFSDSGQFPDIPQQLLELKLQTATTIDLGLVSPDGTGEISDLPLFQHRDVRYAAFYGSVVGSDVRLDYLVLSTGADFFTFFQRFEGQVVNKKLQIHLPSDFFD